MGGWKQRTQKERGGQISKELFSRQFQPLELVVRERIRKILSGLGFVRVQDSVWLYPYDCEDIIALLKTDLRIGKEMLYLIVDMLEGDEAFRNHFSLKK